MFQFIPICLIPHTPHSHCASYRFQYGSSLEKESIAPTQTPNPHPRKIRKWYYYILCSTLRSENDEFWWYFEFHIFKSIIFFVKFQWNLCCLYSKLPVHSCFVHVFCCWIYSTPQENTKYVWCAYCLKCTIKILSKTIWKDALSKIFKLQQLGAAEHLQLCMEYGSREAQHYEYESKIWI